MQKLWRLAAQCLVAILALASLTFICYRLHFNLATAALLYVIVVALLSRAGSLASSIVTSIVATLFLAQLAPPAFSFRVTDPLDEVAIVAFLITSSIIARLMTRVRTQTEEALSSVSYRVIEAEEKQRQRIAQELHENIGQRLSLLVVKIEQLKPDSLKSVDLSHNGESTLQLALKILADVKTMAHELYSPRLEILGIAGVMRSFCRDLGEQKGVEIDFSTDGSSSRVPRNVSLCLFRVLQEALHNAVKYSGVRQMDVQLLGTADAIHLTVRDLGAGFYHESAKSGQGLGLNHMQERLKLVKGSLTIDSRPGRGTKIYACVPLDSDSHSIF
jgi:signal transduction histidine kinase